MASGGCSTWKQHTNVISLKPFQGFRGQDWEITQVLGNLGPCCSHWPSSLWALELALIILSIIKCWNGFKKKKCSSENENAACLNSWAAVIHWGQLWCASIMVFRGHWWLVSDAHNWTQCGLSYASVLLWHTEKDKMGLKLYLWRIISKLLIFILSLCHNNVVKSSSSWWQQWQGNIRLPPLHYLVEQLSAAF